MVRDKKPFKNQNTLALFPTRKTIYVNWIPQALPQRGPYSRRH